jgi:hypothetical protein
MYGCRIEYISFYERISAYKCGARFDFLLAIRPRHRPPGPPELKVRELIRRSSEVGAEPASAMGPIASAAPPTKIIIKGPRTGVVKK